MSDEEERKLVYGLLFSIKNICDKLSDNPSGNAKLPILILGPAADP